MDQQPPKISVILPVYNGCDYLSCSIQSILDQSIKDFELIIINDGSTDDSASIIQSFKDSRIRFINQHNQGLAQTLNNGIALTKGKYIARHDQDDIALPERLEKQFGFLEKWPDYAMVGTWAHIWTGDNKTLYYHRHPIENDILKFELLFNNPFVHSSMMIRRSVFDKVGLYCTEPKRQPPEDYELWSRIARHYKVANIGEVLQIYRELPGSMSRIKKNIFTNRVLTISKENIKHLLKNSISRDEAYTLSLLGNKMFDKLPQQPDFNKLAILFQQIAKELNQNNTTLQEFTKRRLAEIILNYRYYKRPLPIKIIYKMLDIMKLYE